MAQSVRGLTQSAVLCGPEELPLTVDLLQASEAVAAVLCRRVSERGWTAVHIAYAVFGYTPAARKMKLLNLWW